MTTIAAGYLVLGIVGLALHMATWGSTANKNLKQSKTKTIKPLEQ